MTPFAPAQADAAKRARIAVMILNFEGILKLPGFPTNPSETLDLFDVPAMFADRYGVHNIEIQHTHFASTEESYLKELRARAEKSQSRFSNINLEFGPMSISAPEWNLRLQAIDLTRRWVDHAVTLGCPRVMINQGRPTQENKAYATAALKTMVDDAKAKGVMIGVETRGGGSGNNRGVVGATPPTPPAGVAGAGPAAGGPPAGAAAATAVLTAPPNWVLLAEILSNSGALANVDIGGVGAADQGELHAALRTLLPMTVGNMHIRSSPRWDLATAIKFTTTLGYQGLYSIEVRGHEGTLSTIETVVGSL